jgi:nitroreductase
VTDPERLERLANSVYEPQNVRGARLVIAISGGRPFDLGRCAQNMMLAAWSEGVGSTPNGVSDADAVKDALSLDEPPAIVLTFGYPATGGDPQRRSAEEWSARANRKPLEELVERL